MKKVKTFLAIIIALIVCLSTFAGCDGLFVGNDNVNEIEGRYRFASRMDWLLDYDVYGNYRNSPQLKAQYKIGDTIEEQGFAHTYSEDSYILDVYKNETFFLTSYYEFPERTHGYNPQDDLVAFKYTWYKEKQDFFWTDVNEWYYFVRKNLDEPETEEYMLYMAYREKDTIVLTIFDMFSLTEIRLEKVEMSKDEKTQSDVVGRYHLSTLQGVEDGEEIKVTAGVPDGDGYVPPYGQFVFILNADGSMSLSDEGDLFGTGVELNNIQTGTWRIENGNAVLSCEIFEKTFAKSEITLKVGKNKLILEEDIIYDGETISITLTLKK